MPLVHGCIRARYRDSITQPRLLKKNRIYEYNIDLWHIAIKFGKGWRIRAEITSADFPQYSRNLNTGGNNEMEVNYVMAKQRFYHSKKYPSYILLPIIDNI